MKNKLFGMKLKLKSLEVTQKYNKFKKEVKKKLYIAKNDYFKNKLLDSSNNMKKKWDAIRCIINRKKNISNFCPVKSEVLGKHYSTIAEKLNEKLPKLKKMDIPCSSATENKVYQGKEVFLLKKLQPSRFIKKL